MVQHAHRENGVEGSAFGGELIKRDRYHKDWQITQKVLDQTVLKKVGRVRVNTQHHPGAFAQGAITVVGIATANIHHTTTGKRRYMGQHAVPLHVRTPFTVYLNAKQRPGAFAPWYL